MVVGCGRGDTGVRRIERKDVGDEGLNGGIRLLIGRPIVGVILVLEFGVLSLFVAEASRSPKVRIVRMPSYQFGSYMNFLL